MTDVEHDVCGGAASPGSVWKLDLTMQNLQGTLSGEVIHALKVLTGYGLHTIDVSSNHISGSIPDGMFESRDWGNLTTVNLNFNSKCCSTGLHAKVRTTSTSKCRAAAGAECVDVDDHGGLPHVLMRPHQLAALAGTLANVSSASHR